ncbi:hypothetical protein EK21DRAFT_105570 [Setomelanomma holmii]|uniref:Uncharacterized protein n=1 Tax=Setomelanomma holmii TaxID=210430 RepID=A0A9P4GW44_9PLEO|nr:hypothetical protein EK21DRAFT_105570 [Setomelanomma holmii]
MATESDPAVTRVTYINPDVAKEHLPELTEASEPQLIDYQAGATRLSDLTANDRESYRWECDRWERRRSEYRTQEKALADLNTDISKTIAETPYDQLVALKKFLCPTDATCRRELADKYNTLKTALQAAKKGKSIKLPKTDGNRPQEDFLIACKALDQEYATSCLREIFKHEARGSHRDGARTAPPCVCGLQHWYPDCLILNERHPRRPKTFQPITDAVRKVKQAQKDPKINVRIKTALER